MKCIHIGRDDDGVICHYVYDDGWVTQREDCQHYRWDSKLQKAVVVAA